MFERFTDTARHVVTQAQDDARGLGHGYTGCEHLLLAAAAAAEPAGAVLRGQGVTAERIKAEILRASGPAQTAGPAGSLDAEALASIGIDLDAVRARIEAAFGPDALTRALPAARQRRRPAWGKGPLARRISALMRSGVTPWSRSTVPVGSAAAAAASSRCSQPM